jgi:hypothetical protein
MEWDDGMPKPPKTGIDKGAISTAMAEFKKKDGVFRRWFEGFYKKENKATDGIQKNANMTPEAIREAFEEWNRRGRPGTN